jgi:thiol-disulfide isomerase/thioredoxin
VKRALASLFVLAVLAMPLAAADPYKAPELAFNIPGQGQKLLSQYRGKVVAIEFIFTTCPHCQAASKVMSGYQKEFGARGFQAIDVAVNENADLLVENFAKDYQVAFPVGWTPRDQMISFMGFENGRFVVPQMVLIDRKGYIHYKTPALENEDWDKQMKPEVIREHIEELLSSGASASRSPQANGHLASAKKPS